jgi:hypothetical protein
MISTDIQHPYVELNKEKFVDEYYNGTLDGIF